MQICQKWNKSNAIIVENEMMHSILVVNGYWSIGQLVNKPIDFISSVHPPSILTNHIYKPILTFTI